MSTFAWRVLAGCGLLIGLAFTQDPGYLVADTKFDLVAAPGDFVVRALQIRTFVAYGFKRKNKYKYYWFELQR